MWHKFLPIHESKNREIPYVYTFVKIYAVKLTHYMVNHFLCRVYVCVDIEYTFPKKASNVKNNNVTTCNPTIPKNVSR